LFRHSCLVIGHLISSRGFDVVNRSLEIALEHHRAGRVRQAEADYRALIARDANHADAIEWLGVLVYQAGRADEAVGLLERAARLRPDDGAFWHNLGQACAGCGRLTDAIDAFEKSARLVPGRAETLFTLGTARLARRQPGDAELAVVALRQANAAGLDSAELHHQLGMALLSSGLYDEAIASFLDALERRHDYASALYHAALAYRAKGDAPAVRKALNKALELDPNFARAWHALATLDAEAGNFDIAAALFRKAIKANPDYPAAYHGLGKALQAGGRQRDALGAFSQAVRASHVRNARNAPVKLPLHVALEQLEKKLTEEHALEVHHALAAIADVFPPTKIPADKVAKLFDKYADKFDEHLRGQLEYCVPELIVDAVAAVAPDEPMDVLDLGCGTGLCGPLLRPMSQRLCGVDLSAKMIEKARARDVYDELEVGDLVEVLRKVEPNSFDLLVAADVLIYLGDLAPVFEGAARALRPGGRFAFTLEAGGGDRYHLQKKTLRFTHSEAYVRRVSALYGFEVESLEPTVLRMEGGHPVPGYLIVLRGRDEGQA
jgi:predicted TPR repeat methyltransferase